MEIKSAKDLRVYQKAYALAMEIFRLSKTWPPEEKYALTDQVRRSSRSTCSQLREAWAKRRYEAHFLTSKPSIGSSKSEPTCPNPRAAKHGLGRPRQSHQFERQAIGVDNHQVLTMGNFVEDGLKFIFSLFDRYLDHCLGLALRKSEASNQQPSFYQRTPPPANTLWGDLLTTDH